MCHIDVFISTHCPYQILRLYIMKQELWHNSVPQKQFHGIIKQISVRMNLYYAILLYGMLYATDDFTAIFLAERINAQ